MKLLVPKCLMLLIALSSCRNSIGPMEEAQGVWIDAGFSFDRGSDALIIEDSTVTYNPWGPKRYQSPLMVEEGRVICFGPHWEKHSFFTRRGDTLIQFILYDSAVRKFTRAEKDLDITKYLYCDLALQVAIPLWSTVKQRSIDLRDSVRFSANLSFGRLKKGEFAGRPLVSTDSICIQVYDVLIRNDDLGSYIRDQLSILQEIDRRDLTFVLHADRSIPSSFLNVIRGQIASFAGSRVVRAYWDDETKMVRWAEW